MGIDSDDDDGEYVDMPLPSHVAGQQAGLVAWRTEVYTGITCLVETKSKPGLVCVKSQRSLTEPADLSCTPAKGSQTNGAEAEGAGTNQGRPLFKTNAAAPAPVVAVAAAAGPSKPNFMQAMLQKHGQNAQGVERRAANLELYSIFKSSSSWPVVRPCAIAPGAGGWQLVAGRAGGCSLVLGAARFFRFRFRFFCPRPPPTHPGPPFLRGALRAPTHPGRLFLCAHWFLTPGHSKKM
jgi:hypothetical protein